MTQHALDFWRSIGLCRSADGNIEPIQQEQESVQASEPALTPLPEEPPCEPEIDGQLFFTALSVARWA